LLFYSTNLFEKKERKEKRTIQKHKQMNIEKERNKTSVATAINLLQGVGGSDNPPPPTKKKRT
jgi:hypothetical protein